MMKDHSGLGAANAGLNPFRCHVPPEITYSTRSRYSAALSVRASASASAAALPLSLHVPLLMVTFAQPLRRRSRARFSRPSSRRWRVSPTGRDGVCLGEGQLAAQTMHSCDKDQSHSSRGTGALESTTSQPSAGGFASALTAM